MVGSSRKSAYSSVWNTSARNAAATAARVRSARSPAQQDDRRDDHERKVRELADQALLGGDRDRDRVRGRQRLRGARVALAVLVDERARAVSPERPVPEHVDSPPLTRPARPLEAPLRPWLSPKVFGEMASAAPPCRDHCDRRDQRPFDASTAAPPACRGRRAAPQGSSATASAPAHPRAPRAIDCRGDLLARPARMQQHRREQDHHERQEAAEDVRVEEHRVDCEVRVQCRWRRSASG